jgi:hypothetical protein
MKPHITPLRRFKSAAVEWGSARIDLARGEGDRERRVHVATRLGDVRATRFSDHPDTAFIFAGERFMGLARRSESADAAMLRSTCWRKNR